ncbi:hypothetical protein HpBT0205_12700 [Helicobacter pylori]
MISVYIISLKESQRRLDTEKLVLESNEKFKGRCVFQIFDAIGPKTKILKNSFKSFMMCKAC